MVQDLQVVLGAGPLVAALAELVVGQAEARGREQIVAVGVLCERARLTDQRVDDVPIVHRVAIAAHQPRQRVNVLVRVPDLNAVGKEPGFDLLVDQSTVHRIDVAVNMNQAAGVDATGQLQARRQPRLGQVFERRNLLGEAILSTRVPRRHNLLQELHVLVAAGELAAAAEQQCLIDRRLEVPVRRLRIAVLVRLPGVDSLARHTVVCQQIAIACLKLARRREVVHRRSQGIAAVPSWHAAQFPEGVLQAVGERLERLRCTQRHGLPVRVGEHEVVHHVIETLAGDRDVQRAHVREVGGREIAGVVDLAEHDRLPRSMRRPPLPHATLEGTAMRIEELARMLATQPVEERLGEQPWLGLEPLLDCGPDRRKRIGPCAVSPRHGRLLPRAGQLAVIAVLTGGLVAHACSPGRQGQGSS